MKPQNIMNLTNYAALPFLRIKRRLFEINDDPKKIAHGFALGTFLGLTPFIGLQVVMAILIASLLRWNKISAGIAVFNTNLITGPFIYGISYYIGTSLLGISNRINFPEKMGFTVFWNLIFRSYEMFLSMCIGGVILGLPTSIFAYYISLYAVKTYQLRMIKTKNHNTLNQF
jgi:uncharacterized protein (TIGR03546 family)